MAPVKFLGAIKCTAMRPSKLHMYIPCAREREEKTQMIEAKNYNVGNNRKSHSNKGAVSFFKKISKTTQENYLSHQEVCPTQCDKSDKSQATTNSTRTQAIIKG